MANGLFSLEAVNRSWNTRATKEGDEARRAMLEKAEESCRIDLALGGVLKTGGLELSQAALALSTDDGLKLLRFLPSAPLTIILDDRGERILQILIDRARIKAARAQGRNFAAERAGAVTALQETLIELSIRDPYKTDGREALYFIDGIESRRELKRAIAAAGAAGIAKLLGVPSAVVVQNEYGHIEMIDNQEGRVTRYLTRAQQDRIAALFADREAGTYYDKSDNQTLISMGVDTRTIGLVRVRGNEALFEENDRLWLKVAIGALRQALVSLG